MAVKVTITLDAPDDILGAAAYGAGSVMQLQSAAAESFGTPSDVTEIAIVAAQYLYEYWDAAGDATTWYRWRVENSADTELGDWSVPFQGTDPALAMRNALAYATPDDLLLRFPTVPADSRRLAAAERALVESADRLRHEIGWDFYRAPQSGTTTRTYQGTNSPLLHVHAGIVSLSTVEIRENDTSSWLTVDSSDWQLLCMANQNDPFNRRAGEPWDHVQLTGVLTYSKFPAKGGVPRIRLTGAFNWDPSPRSVSEANIAWARQQLAADPSFPGGIVGPDELGRPVGPNRMPDSVWRLKLWAMHRFSCAT